jgi:hypothetical protein
MVGTRLEDPGSRTEAESRHPGSEKCKPPLQLSSHGAAVVIDLCYVARELACLKNMFADGHLTKHTDAPHASHYAIIHACTNPSIEACMVK